MSTYHKTLKSRDKIDDWPFWYGERPLVGFLVAGIWGAGGVCIEEYATDKKPDVTEREEESYLGRGDLFFRHGDHEGDIEFKMHNIGISQTHHFAGFLKRKWRQGSDDAKKGHQPGIQSSAGMFLRPYVGEHRDTDQYDANMKHLLQVAWDTVKPDALAWWCPTRRVLDPKEKDTKDWVVGVILLIKRVR